MGPSSRPAVLVTNDDGIYAPGRLPHMTGYDRVGDRSGPWRTQSAHTHTHVRVRAICTRGLPVNPKTKPRPAAAGGGGEVNSLC